MPSDEKLDTEVHQNEEQAREYLEEMKRRSEAGETEGVIHIGGEDDWNDFVGGLLSLSSDDKAPHEHWCTNCREHRIFDVLALVPRPEFNVTAPVKGCPECEQTKVIATEMIPHEN